MKRTGIAGLVKCISKSNSGFTLVEVICSFAVLTIVSVALMQMFSVSAKTNRSAYDQDKANALCIETGEFYKADPERNEIPVQFAVSGTSTSGITYTQYLDSNWGNPRTTIDPANSAYMLEIVQEPATASAISASYHPDYAWSGNVDPVNNALLPSIVLNSELTMNIYNTDPSTVYVKLGVKDERVTSGAIRYQADYAVIPIQIKSQDTDITIPTAYRINISNSATLPTGAGVTLPVMADIYLCDSPSGAGIELNSVAGASTENRINSGESVTREYSAMVRAIRLSDGLTMAEYKIRKHMVD